MKQFTCIAIGCLMIFMTMRVKGENINFLNPPESTLTVLSVPSGIKVYVVPQHIKYSNPAYVLELTKSKYLKGKTPLQVELKSDFYMVVLKEDRFAYRKDGESDNIYTLKNKTNVAEKKAKIYYIKHVPGDKTLVTALFWSTQESFQQFLKKFPRKEIFKISDQDQLQIKQILKEKEIPETDQKYMVSMLKKTGKAVWYGSDRSKYLCLYYEKLGHNGKLLKMIVKPKRR